MKWRKKSGSVAIDEKEVKSVIADPKLLGFIPEDRQKTGLIMDFTVAENLIIKEYESAPPPQLFPAFLQQIPVVGPIFFAQPITTYIALVLPFIVAFVLYKTNWELNVRAVGDNPQAAGTAGLSVIKIKYQTVILSGMFAAMGGCFLTLAETGFFASGGMTNGRGFKIRIYSFFTCLFDDVAILPV